MKPRFQALFCFAFLAFSCGSSPAATVRFAWTNSVGNPDTNWFIVYPVGDVAQADGSFITKGPVTRLTPNASGLVTNTFEVGTYVASNRFLGRGIAFRVPNDHGPTVYCATCGTNNTPAGTGLAISGFNYFITITYGTNPPPTYDEITNSLGFLPGIDGVALTNNESRAVTLANTLTVADKITAANMDLDYATANSGVFWAADGVLFRSRNGSIYTNLALTSVVGLEAALDYLTNTISSGGEATNVTQVAAGSGVTIVTNQLLRTLIVTNVTGSFTGYVFAAANVDMDGWVITNLNGLRPQVGETIEIVNAVIDGTFTGNGAAVTNLTAGNIALNPQILLDPPHIGVSSNLGNYFITENNSHGVMISGCGILRDVWIQVDLDKNHFLNTNLVNIRLEVFTDGGNTTNLTFRNVDVSLADVFGNRFRFETNGAWAVDRDSLGLFTMDRSTNLLRQGYIKALHLRLPIYFTNNCLLRLTNALTGTLWAEGYMSVTGQRAADLSALGEYQTWRLRTKTTFGALAGSASNFLFSVSGPGICVGWLQSFHSTTAFEVRNFLDSVAPAWLTAPGVVWEVAGGDDMFFSTFSMKGGFSIGPVAGVINHDAGPALNEARQSIEAYRWLFTDPIYWNNGTVVYIPDSQAISAMSATMFYYGP